MARKTLTPEEQIKRDAFKDKLRSAKDIQAEAKVVSAEGGSFAGGAKLEAERRLTDIEIGKQKTAASTRYNKSGGVCVPAPAGTVGQFTTLSQCNAEIKKGFTGDTKRLPVDKFDTAVSKTGQDIVNERVKALAEERFEASVADTNTSIERGRKDAATRLTEIRKQTAGQQGAVTSSFAKGRGGLTDTVTTGLKQVFGEDIQDRDTARRNELDAFTQSLDNAENQLRLAIESDDLKKQQSILDDVAALKQQQQLLIEEQDKQTVKQTEELLDMVNSTDSSLIGATPEEIDALAAQSNIPSFLLRGIQSSQLSAMESTGVDKQLKQAQLQKTLLDVANYADNKLSPQAKLFNERNSLVDGGATDAELASFDKLIGLTEDPSKLSITKVGDDVYAIDPTTGKTTKIVGDLGTNNLLPSGVMGSAVFDGRKVTLDTAALVSFSDASNAMKAAGLGDITIGSVADSSYRNQSDTIARMAQRFNIGFNAENPNETAEKLRKEGHRVANVGDSLHEKGLAVDIFPNHEYISQVKPFLEAAGWKQTFPVDDAGHFEFQGVVKDKNQLNTEKQVRSFVQSRSGIKDKDARLQAEKDYLELINDTSNDISTPQEAKIFLGTVTPEDKEVKTRISTDLKPIKTDNNKIIRNVNNIMELTNISGGIGDTAAITGFLKTIDPGSVARESEVAGVENARGLFDNINVWFEKLGTGARLSESQKADLKEAAQVLGQLSNENLYERLIIGKQELLDRGVDPTNISDFQIRKLERDIGEDRVQQIKQENGLTEEVPQPVELRQVTDTTEINSISDMIDQLEAEGNTEDQIIEVLERNNINSATFYN